MTELETYITLYLADWREQAKLYLADLALVTEISRTGLHRILHYQKDPPLSLFARLGQHYQINPYDLFSFVGCDRPHGCHCDKAKEVRP